MKACWLSLIVLAFAATSLLAQESPNSAAPLDATAAAEQFAKNPDDPKAFTVWLNATFKEISELVDTAPDEAEKKLALAKEFVGTLKPESAVGKTNLTRAKLIAANFEESLALRRIPMADLEKAVDANPNDLKALSRYRSKLSMEIGSIARTEPEQAEQLMTVAQGRVTKLKEAANESAKKQWEAVEKLFPTLGRSIDHGRELAALIGQPAPKLNIEDWANGSPLTAEDLKGKVVLLDFWAIWCGPCIATFPHLREWHEHYADKGLVIVGMTRYYNFKWDEAANKPLRAKEKGEVSHADEQVMLKHFAKLHRLPHRFAIQTEEHSLAEALAVKGIPQAVVIDRQGVVRLIRVGSGSKNAKAIHDTIEKLLAEKPVAAR